MKPTDGILFNGFGIIIYILILLSGILFFGYTIYRRYLLLKVGKDDNRFDQIGKRIKNVLLFVFGQKRILHKSELVAGVMHATIFWGFVIISLRTVTVFGQGFMEGFSLPFLSPGSTLGNFYLFVKDITEVFVTLAVLFAFYRRMIIKPERLELSKEALLILLFIFILMVTDLLGEGAEFTLNPGGVEETFSIIGAQISLLLKGIGDTGLNFIYKLSWWTHIVVILVFLNMLPRSKHFHIITAIFNVFFSKITPKGKLKFMELEEAETFGNSKIDDFTWKEYLDLYTCTECGRCSDNCPANLTKKPLSPKKLSIALRDHLYEVGDSLIDRKIKKGEEEENGGTPIIDNIIEEEVLWSCTTCRACEEACPVFIEYIDKIIEMRRYLVFMESRFPSELKATFKGIENNSNPWGMGKDYRADWAEGLGIKLLSEDKDVDILYFVGCAGSFDNRNKKISTAMANIMKKAGVNFGILGIEEGCCGDPARRIGNEYLFQMLAQTNIETFNSYGIKKIVTACPHCFNTIKNEYPDMGGNYEVLHSTEFILQLIKEGKLSISKGMDITVTYHDSCYLGRHNDRYDPPREILKVIPNINIIEMKRNKDRGLCCGAGGGRMWMEEKIGTRMNENRLEDVLEINPQALTVACPFCMTMLEDAIKVKELEDSLKTYDIVEIVNNVL